MSQSKILRETIFEKFRENLLSNPLVIGILNNTLTHNKSRLYAIQSYMGLQTYIRVLQYSQSLTDSDEIEDLKNYISIMHQKKSEVELSLTELYGISIEELKSIKLLPNYDSYFYRMLNMKSFTEIAAFAIPVHIAADDLGKGMVKSGAYDPVYVKGHQLWAEMGEWFEKRLDQRLGSASKEEIEKINELYIMGCNYALLIYSEIESEQKWPFGDIKVC